MDKPPHDLNEREEQILHAVVTSYVTTAEPVGSRTIVKRFGLEVSPATVRNVMADLEEREYLQQIHTSSGRVPTDKGYRYYVDHLMEVQRLTQAECERIELELSQRLDDADAVLRHTSHLLALVSRQTGIAQSPMESDAHVRRIELLPVSASHVAFLIVDSFSRVHTMAVDLGETLPESDLFGLVRFLNEQLRGVAMSELAATLHERMRDYIEAQRRLAERALRLLHLLPAQPRGQLFLDGATQLFEQPEFRDVTKAREVFGLLEEHDRLVEVLRTSVTRDGSIGSKVVIGAEAREQALDDISVVAAPYKIGDESIGMIGVLGPRRMPYPRLTALVDFTAGMVGRLLTRLSR